MNPWYTAIPLSYLLGSIPFGYLLVRFLRHEDVRRSGSGNIGATNVARSGGKLLGLWTLLLDLLKGAVAVVAATSLASRYAPWQHLPPDVAAAHRLDLAAAAALGAVLGHMFPVWLGFRGGKGVATGLGVFLALAPLATLYLVGVFLLVAVLTRYVSLASIVAAASFPVFAYVLTGFRDPLVAAVFLGIPALIIAKHHGNIGRLRAGTESRFGADRQKAAA